MAVGAMASKTTAATATATTTATISPPPPRRRPPPPPMRSSSLSSYSSTPATPRSSSLLNHSDLPTWVDWTNMFGSELWSESDDIFGQFRQLNGGPDEQDSQNSHDGQEELDSQDGKDEQNEQDPQAMADAIFAQDEYDLPSSCPAAAFLGRSDSLAQQVRERYMEKFNFKKMPLDDAFRMLCSKLYLKAESQEIDRILESFARRYWYCNMSQGLEYRLYGHTDIVHAIIYSLMLLNTDLHIVTGHARMTQVAFVQNTMSTIQDHLASAKETIELYGGLTLWQQALDLHLASLYVSVKQEGFRQPPTEKTGQGAARGLLHRMGSMKQIPAKRQPSQSQSQPPAAGAATLPRVSQRAAAAQQPMNRARSFEEQKQYLAAKAEIDDSRPPLLEGKLSCKWIPASGTSTKHHGYREYWVSLDVRHGMLRLDPTSQPSYVAKPMGRANTYRKRSSSEGGAAFGSSGLRAPFLFTHHADGKRLDLEHALATVQNTVGSSTILSSSPHGFLLTLHDGGAYLFHCGSEDEATQWARQVNYLAARKSKIPLRSGVSSNTSFGWEPHIVDQKANMDHIALYEWKPNNIPSRSPNQQAFVMDEQEQGAAVQSYLASLLTEQRQHMVVKKKIDALLKEGRGAKWSQINANWRAKKHHLDEQVQKYSSYSDAIK
ncbi:hypothetical protein BCR43DRAFT_561575, partial [Syncephalastrum racemosum]